MNSILYDINTLYKRKETLKLLIDEINKDKQNKDSQQIVCKINIIGDGNAFADNNISIAIKYKLDFDYFKKIQNILLNGNLNNVKYPVKPHVTIHMINFNKTHKDTNKFVQTSLCPTSKTIVGKLTPVFENAIIKAFNETLKDKLTLTHTSDFKKMGIFYALIYTVNDNTLISNFRNQIYKYIKEQIGSNLSSVEISRNNPKIKGKIDKFFAYCDKNGDVLYAVQDYFHGFGNWTPHVSIIKENDIKYYNKELFNILTKQNANVSHDINNIINIQFPSEIQLSNSKFIENSVFC